MSVFHFKKFSVEQSRSAAKITTDATVFASSLQPSIPPISALEVGTGSGVLSLMMAQRLQEVVIDALEINPEAFEEAKTNFRNSPWNTRLNVFLKDFNHFQSIQKYDLIFSNPPFFQNNLKSKINHGKNTAYHTDSLSFESLAKGIDVNLADLGEAHIMLPPYEMSLFEREMNRLGFLVKKCIELRHKPHGKVIRNFYAFSKCEEVSAYSQELIIVRDENNNFHPSYVNLLKDFLTIF